MRAWAAALVAGLFLIMALALVWTLALQGLAEQVEYVGPDGEPRLRLVWRTLIWYVGGGAVTAQLFTALVGILGIAGQSLADIHKQLWSVLLVCLLCVAGIVGCVIVMAVIDPEGAVITALRAEAGGEESALRSSIQTFIGGVMAWFVLFMGRQLQISWSSATGAVRALVAGGSSASSPGSGGSNAPDGGPPAPPATPGTGPSGEAS